MAMAYGYNDASHLNAVTDIDLNGTNRTFSYDLNGNMTGGYDLTDPAAVVSRSITDTADNMPAAITRGAATTDFVYDGDGRRAKKTAGSNTTVYANDLYEIITLLPPNTSLPATCASQKLPAPTSSIFTRTTWAALP